VLDDGPYHPKRRGKCVRCNQIKGLLLMMPCLHRCICNHCARLLYNETM